MRQSIDDAIRSSCVRTSRGPPSRNLPGPSPDARVSRSSPRRSRVSAIDTGAGAPSAPSLATTAPAATPYVSSSSMRAASSSTFENRALLISSASALSCSLRWRRVARRPSARARLLLEDVVHELGTSALAAATVRGALRCGLQPFETRLERRPGPRTRARRCGTDPRRGSRCGSGPSGSAASRSSRRAMSRGLDRRPIRRPRRAARRSGSAAPASRWVRSSSRDSIPASCSGGTAGGGADARAARERERWSIRCATSSTREPTHSSRSGSPAGRAASPSTGRPEVADLCLVVPVGRSSRGGVGKLVDALREPPDAIAEAGSRPGGSSAPRSPV